MNPRSALQPALDFNRRGTPPATEVSLRRGVLRVTGRRFAGSGQAGVDEYCQVVEEDALTIDVVEVGTYTLMWTPTDSMVDTDGAGYLSGDGLLGDADSQGASLALAVGFTMTEGIIQGLDDILTMGICSDKPGVVRMQLKDPHSVLTRRRNVLMTSSCGICGSREVLENNTFGLCDVPDKMRLDARGFSRLMDEMHKRQAIFAETGGAHAAAVFSADGRIHALAEDLGRHNALDEVIGATLLRGSGFEERGVLLSSRLSLEMVTKAVRAGLEIVAAVGAPTSLALEVAEQFGLTVCAFVRGERATVFTHPHRIVQSD